MTPFGSSAAEAAGMANPSLAPACRTMDTFLTHNNNTGGYK